MADLAETNVLLAALRGQEFEVRRLLSDFHPGELDEFEEAIEMIEGVLIELRRND